MDICNKHKQRLRVAPFGSRRTRGHPAGVNTGRPEAKRLKPTIRTVRPVRQTRASNPSGSQGTEGLNSPRGDSRTPGGGVPRTDVRSQKGLPSAESVSSKINPGPVTTNMRSILKKEERPSGPKTKRWLRRRFGLWARSAVFHEAAGFDCYSW